MKKLIDFPDITIEKLNEICKHEGHKSFSAAVISVVSSYYNKEYFDKRKVPGVAKPIEEALTDEQYCEMFGGKVQKNADGNFVCIKGIWSVPLNQRGMISSRFKEK